MPDLITELGLEPHPEGGYYRRTYTASDTIGLRPAVTLIHFFLPTGDSSAWHMVTSDEIWLWHGPGSLTIELGGSAETPTTEKSLILGPPPLGHPQILVPGHTWQRTLPASNDTLVSCMVTPGFSFEDFRLANAQDT